eukprot:scaffold905_cov310-Prasinococcus_capsulatus_cf.AAC.2
MLNHITFALAASTRSRTARSLHTPHETPLAPRAAGRLQQPQRRRRRRRRRRAPVAQREELLGDLQGELLHARELLLELQQLVGARDVGEVAVVDAAADAQLHHRRRGRRLLLNLLLLLRLLLRPLRRRLPFCARRRAQVTHEARTGASDAGKRAMASWRTGGRRRAAKVEAQLVLARLLRVRAPVACPGPPLAMHCLAVRLAHDHLPIRSLPPASARATAQPAGGRRAPRPSARAPQAPASPTP